MKRSFHARVLFAAVMSAAGLAIGMSTLASAKVGPPQQQCPNTPVVTTTVPTVPVDVCIPSGFPGNQNPIAFFDDYSWRAFIAMVWPALQGQRGQPDPAKHVGDVSGPLVFQTYKADWELFRPNGGPPTDWNLYGAEDPCGNTSIGFNDFVLASFTKLGNLGQAGSGGRANPLIHALPAQNGTWVRYATGFNQIEFTQIQNGKLYLLSNLQAAKPLTFQNGAVDVKSSWVDMTGLPTARYYTRWASVMDPVSGACSQKLMGLVGLHIVQKTPTRPQWIWSTFEQVDNVPGQTSGPFGFNDGTSTRMPPKDPNVGFPPPSWVNPVVYNVTRIQKIHTTTVTTNTAYQKALGGVWQYYQLVMTQWPLQKTQGAPIPPTQNGFPANTFPGTTGANTSFANATLETWDQKSISTGCMACHTLTQQNSDFLWALEINAFAPMTMAMRAGKAMTQSRPPIDQLRQLLETSHMGAKPAPAVPKR